MNLEVEGNEEGLERAHLIAAVAKTKTGLPQIAIYTKDGDKLRQIGLVKEFHLSATMENNGIPTVDVNFGEKLEGLSPKTSAARDEYISLLKEAGCSVRED